MYIQRPPTLFLIDGLGALLSAILLGVVLVQFEAIFGMPPNVLYGLAGIAGGFCIYSLSCFLRKPENWRPYLKGIAIANLAYCALTAGLVVYFRQRLTGLGILYFVLEIAVIVGLSVFELKTASNGR